LGVQSCLRPQFRLLYSGKVVLDESKVIVCHRAVTGEPGRTTSLWLVCQVEGVALVEEVGCPAFAAVRGVEPILLQTISKGLK
jgi:hypothetical protein